MPPWASSMSLSWSDTFAKLSWKALISDIRSGDWRLAIQEKRRAHRRRRRAEKRWRHSIIWRLQQRQAPVWVPDDTSDHKSLWSKLKRCFWNVHWGILSTARRTTRNNHRHRHGMKLNLWALPRCQLEAAALEAGVPLDTLLPADFYETYDQDACHHAFGIEHHPLPSWFATHSVYHRDDRAPEPPTHRRLAAMLTKFSFCLRVRWQSPSERI